MPRLIATFVCLLGIAGLFILNRDRESRTSGALWLPVLWMFLSESRTVTQWMAILGFGSASLFSAPDQYLEGSPLERNVYLALTVLGIIILAKRHRQLLKLLRENGPVLLFFSYCAFSIFWSDYPDVAFKRWIKALGDLVVVLIILTESDQRAALKRVFSRVGFFLLPLSILFINYYPQWGRSYWNVLGTVSYTGVTTSKNLLGLTTAICGLAALWCFIQAFRERKNARRTGQLLAQGIVVAMAIRLFWIVNSATSLACFLMAAGFILVTSLFKWGRKPWVVNLIFAAVLSVSVFGLFFDSAGSLVGTLGRDSSLTGRTDIWKLALSMQGNPLIGRGFESFWIGDRLQKTWNVYRFHLNEAHNGYVDLYLELGWIGIGLLAVLIFTGYRNLSSAFRRDPVIAGLKFAYFMVAITYNFTETGFRILNPVWILFFLVICAVPESASPERPPLVRFDHTHDFARREPQLEHVLAPKVQREAV